eukprot:666172-Pyramimonas_sp.AAC.2
MVQAPVYLPQVTAGGIRRVRGPEEAPLDRHNGPVFTDPYSANNSKAAHNVSIDQKTVKIVSVSMSVHTSHLGALRTATLDPSAASRGFALKLLHGDAVKYSSKELWSQGVPISREGLLRLPPGKSNYISQSQQKILIHLTIQQRHTFNTMDCDAVQQCIIGHASFKYEHKA